LALDRNRACVTEGPHACGQETKQALLFSCNKYGAAHRLSEAQRTMEDLRLSCPFYKIPSARKLYDYMMKQPSKPILISFSATKMRIAM